MTYCKFDEQQCQEIWRQYDQEKLSTVELAKAWGCADSTITRCIYRAGGQLHGAAELKANSKNRKLTDAQELQAIEMSKAGMPQRQIGDELGVSITPIRNAFRRLGFKSRSSGEANRLARGISDEQLAEAVRLRVDEGWSCKRIGKQIGIGKNRIQRHLVEKGLMKPERLFKPTWFDEAIEMYQSGMTLKQVADAIGISRSTVNVHFEHHGIERRSLKKISPVQELEVVRLYVEDGLTSYDIGSLFGGSDVIINRILDRHGVERRRIGDVLQKFTSVQRQEMAELYESGMNLVQIADQFGTSHPVICKYLLQIGIDIRDSNSPYDTIQHLLNGTGSFGGNERECGFYIAGLANHPGYQKLGIAYSYRRRAWEAGGEYSIEPELELRFGSRQEAYLLEQAVLDATRASKGCPEELQGWDGCTEVRHMEVADLSDIAVRLADELEELGLWEFAVRFVPMTASQVAVCQMKSQIGVA